MTKVLAGITTSIDTGSRDFTRAYHPSGPSARHRSPIRQQRAERPEARGLSNKHHTESSHSHDQKRKAHDRKMREYEQHTTRPTRGTSRRTPASGWSVVAVVAVVSITLLFISGVIRW